MDGDLAEVEKKVKTLIPDLWEIRRDIALNDTFSRSSFEYLPMAMEEFWLARSDHPDDQGPPPFLDHFLAYHVSNCERLEEGNWVRDREEGEEGDPGVGD